MKLMFKRTSSHRNNPALRDSQKHKCPKANDPQVHNNTPVNTGRLWCRQPGVLQQGQKGKFSVFEQLHSRAPSSHTEGGNCVTGHCS